MWFSKLVRIVMAVQQGAATRKLVNGDLRDSVSVGVHHGYFLILSFIIDLESLFLDYKDSCGK